MATEAENIQTAIEQCAANLAWITRNPRPSHTLNGITYDHATWFKLLTEQLKELRMQLQAAGGVFEVRSFGV